jgi:sugar lactone lactonase YvrE
MALPVPARAAQSGVELPTGRLASPAGRITPLQAFPTGLAISPDGQTALVIAGPPIQGGAPAGPGGVSLMVIDTATGVVRQVIQEDDAFQGVVFTRDGRRAFVAGGSDQKIHELDVGAGGVFSKGPDISVGAFLSGLALSPDERNLWVAEPEANRVVRLDLGGGAPGLTVTAPTPDELQLGPGGHELYASAWRGSTVVAISTTTGAVRQIPVGGHPTGLALTTDGRLLGTDSNDATLATVAPGGLNSSLTDLAQLGRRSDAPNAVVTAPGGRAYVSLGADNAIAVLEPRKHAPSRAWRLAGLIPTGWYPTALALSSDGKTLNIVTARGLGHSAAATSPFLDPDPASLVADGAYGTVGTLETLPVPDAATLRSYTRTVRRTLAPRTPPQPATNPVLAGPAGPIKHVIYVTRENKTYDADLGDLHPGPGTGLVLFGQTVTPNLHALERQFAESQNFSYQGFASVVGHMWEDAGTVSDVFERAVASNTGTHFAHLNDSWTDPTNYPASGLLTEQAWRAGLSVRTYNEELAQQSRLLPAAFQADPSVFPNYDLHVPDSRREQGWEGEFQQFESHHCTGALATTYGSHCALPALEYVYFGEDHTTVVDEPGYPTIQAQVADNDFATGKLIDAVSHSSDWRSTLVIVVEDDPQGTGDHLSAYRGFLAIASPYVKHGYISTTSYNLTSAVGAIDRILGLHPLTDYAQTNRPLDELFTPVPDMTRFTADASGIARYPFISLPGVPPTADAAHGIYSFARPDQTNPAIANAATWQQVKGNRPPGG